MKKNIVSATLMLLSCCSIAYGEANQSCNPMVSAIAAPHERQSRESNSVTGGRTDSIVNDVPEESFWSRQPKEKKMLYTNLAAITAIGIWGLTTWDYGQGWLNIGNEGWFELDSKYGGADKLGHLWPTTNSNLDKRTH